MATLNKIMQVTLNLLSKLNPIQVSKTDRYFVEQAWGPE